MKRLLTDEEYHILRSFFADGLTVKGFDNIVEKINKYDLEQIGDEVILIKKVQARFPSDEYKKEEVEYYIKLLKNTVDELNQHRASIKKFEEKPFSVELNIPRLLSHLGEAIFYNKKLEERFVRIYEGFGAENRYISYLRRIHLYNKEYWGLCQLSKMKGIS